MAKNLKSGSRNILNRNQADDCKTDMVRFSAEKTSYNRNIIGHYGVRKGYDFLHKNCGKNIKVKDIIEAAGLSRRGFYKAFNKHIGVSPGKILRLQRLDMAKDLLNNSNFSLVEIARNIGFRNVNSFWVSFKNTEGISPGKFRRESRLAD
jgi:transcriptional regulator GlxA family with amidase domain